MNQNRHSVSFKIFAVAVLTSASFTVGALAQTSLTATDFVSSTAPTESARLNRNGVPSVYPDQKPFPGTIAGTYGYDIFTLVNPFAQTTEFDIDLTYQGSTNLPFSVAYLGAFDPNNIATNYLGDAGSSPIAGDSPYSVGVPAGGILTLIVNEVNPGAGTGYYTLTANAVPEPTTWALAITGLLFFGLFLGRRRKA